MSRKRLICVMAGLILFARGAPLLASAANVYIGQTAIGSTDGADCNDTYAYTFFNTSSNWGTGAAQIGPGTVVHLCGTITNDLVAQGSGSSGNVIEIHFETGANITVPTCLESGISGSCLNLGSNSYILVDGGTPCGWNVVTNSTEGTCNGYISDTANGQGLANNNPDIGISTSGTNIEIRNIGIYNIYVANGNVSGPSSNPSCIETTATGTVNFSFHDSTCHDAQAAINNIHEASSSGYSIYDNYIYNINGGVVGVMDGTTSNVNFYGNWIGNFEMWQPVSSYHHDGIYVFCDGYTTGCATLSNWNVYNNVFGGQWGQYITANWYVDNTENASGVNIFNNVFGPTDAQISGSGLTALFPGGSSTYNEYNNTYLSNSSSTIGCAETGSNGSSLTVAFENNLFQGCDAYVVVYLPFSFSPATNNVYATCEGPGGNCWEYNKSFVGFSTWKSDTGDANSSYYASTTASLSANYVPAASSVAAGAGTNLTSVCSGQPNPGLGALCYDAGGNPRPTTGSWGVGAYNPAPGTATGLKGTAY